MNKSIIIILLFGKPETEGAAGYVEYNKQPLYDGAWINII